MFFVIKSSTPNTDLMKYRTKRHARLKLALYYKGPSEILLSNYLQENYNKTLHSACLEILQALKFSMNAKQEIIATIPDEELNKIAKIITYGTGKISGSRILKNILTIE
jgi:hypothetical protein